ncbi:D-ribose transporter subunit RbsB [compost metagenome]
MQAVRNAGKAGSVYVFGIDGSEQLAKGLMANDNVLQAVTAQSPFDMGAQGVDSALAILKGEKVAEQTTVPALLLSRAEPDGVKAFADSLKK